MRVRTVLATAVPVAGLFLAGVVAAGPAAALDNLGSLTLQPTSGTVDDVLTMTTSGPCPAGAKLSKSRIIGPGFPVRGTNMSGLAPGFTSNTKPFPVTAGFTLKVIAGISYPPAIYDGTYRLEVVCVAADKGEVGAFSTQITFSNPVQWTQAKSSVPVKPGPTVSVPNVVASTPGKASESSQPKPSASSSTTGSPDAPSTVTPSDTSSAGSAAPTESDTGTSGPAAPDLASAQGSGGSSPWLPLGLGLLAGAGGAFLITRRRPYGGSRHAQ